MRILSLHVPTQGLCSASKSQWMFQFLVLLLLFRLEVTFSLQSLHRVHVPAIGVSMAATTETVTCWTVPMAGLVLSEETTLSARRARSIATMTKTQQQRQQHKDQYYETALNVTLPVALTILAPELFTSLSKARRLIRQKRILVTIPNTNSGTQQHGIDNAAINTTTNHASVVSIGTSATRIYPGHVISIPSFSNKTLPTNMTNMNSNPPSTVQQQQSIAKTSGYPNLSYTKVSGLLPKVVYQDDDIAILHKLAGMICHSIGKGGYDSNSILKMAPLVLTPPTTARAHLHQLDDDDDGAADDSLPWPTLAHRLDTRTSGLLIMSKTKTASVSLSHQFATQQVLKTYHALVHGRPQNDEGILESKIVQMVPTKDVDLTNGNERGATDVDEDQDNHDDDGGSNHNGKSATTHYKVLQSIPTSKGTFLSWIEFQPRTGRRHQLRQHAAYELSCPIVGDVLYGEKNTNPSSSSSPYMYLCSTRVAFRHPRTNEWLDVAIPTPRRFSTFWEREKGRYDNHQRWLVTNNCDNTE